MDLFNKVHIFEPMKVHTFEPNIRLIRLFSLMLNYAKPRLGCTHIYHVYKHSDINLRFYLIL